MSVPEVTGSEQNDTKFKPGVSGNPAGRPKGARSKLGEAFIEAMRDSFVQHGPSTIETVRVEKPDQYLKVITAILPKEFDLGEEGAAALANALRVTFRG